MKRNENYRVIPPLPALSGERLIPADKSITHRAILLASLAEGRSILHNWLTSEDCFSVLRLIQQLGIQVKQDRESLYIEGKGLQGWEAPHHALDCGNSGTLMRLVVGLLAGQSFNSELVGDVSLQSRPMRRVTDPLTLMGACVTTQPEGTAPIMIKQVERLSGIRYELLVPSAQVKSGILFAGLYAKGETSVIEKVMTRDHSERMLIDMEYPLRIEDKTITITGGHALKPLKTWIPRDLSSAAFFIVAATIIPGSNLSLPGIGMNPTRSGVIAILRQMGANIAVLPCDVSGSEIVADCKIQSASLKGIEVGAEWAPLTIDDYPILFIAAAFAKGETIFRGVGELRVKESDRISAMLHGLHKMGVRAEVKDDDVYITGSSLHYAEIETFGDHRIAMSFSIAGAAAEGVKIDCEKMIATSFPGFFEMLISNN